MNGQWDCARLDELFHRLLRADVDTKIGKWTRLRFLGHALRHKLFNRQSSRRAFQVGEHHYDIGNDVFEAILDPSMDYSSGYWRNASNLTQAQFDKMDLICRKLDLHPGERLLEIGWGGLARFAAMHYGVEVLGITISKEQQKLAKNRCTGLPVSIELRDYSDLDGQYDKVVSVGMFEHVDHTNYTTYFEVIDRVLKDDGRFLLHTIGVASTSSRIDPWIDKYIFPNGNLPSAQEITTAAEPHFVIADWHHFGPDYDRTLMAWWENFDRAWPQLSDQYGRRFYRIWQYYLLSYAGFFRSDQGQLWQIVLGHHGHPAMIPSVQ